MEEILNAIVGYLHENKIGASMHRQHFFPDEITIDVDHVLDTLKIDENGELHWHSSYKGLEGTIDLANPNFFDNLTKLFQRMISVQEIN